MKIYFSWLFAVIFTLTAGVAEAQNTSGTVKFERRVFWIEIMSQLPWITQADIDRDRLTWGKRQGKNGSPHVLIFNEDMSLYQAEEVESESGYNWRKEEYKVIRDVSNNKSKDIVETLDKKYIIEDELPKYKWKILNEIKEVSGYLCMKAETYDPIKKQVIHAWFTDAIPVQAGPEGFTGLPGMILEININDGCVLIQATEVTIAEDKMVIPVPKKVKGKKIDREKFNAMLEKFIADSYAAERNPYWRIRY